MTSSNGHFPHSWHFVRGIHWSLVESPHKCQWRGVLKFSLIYAWKNGSVNNWDAGDLRRHRAHYDVIVMSQSQGTAAAHAPWNAIIISVHFSLYPETFNLKIPTKVFPQYIDFIRSIVRVGSVCIYLFRDPVCFQFTCLAALDPIRLKEGRAFPYHIMCYSEVCRLQNNLHFELYRRYPEGGGGGGGGGGA